MNFKLAWILLAVLLLAIGGLLIVTLSDDTPALGDILLQPLVGVKEDDVDTVEVVRAEPSEEKIVFKRVGKEKWEIVEPGRAKADAFAIKKVIADLLILKPTPSKDVTDNKTVHGLDKPGLRVTLKAGAKAATLNVGDTTIGRNAITFVTTDTRNVPVAVLRGDIDGIFRPTAVTEGQEGKSWQKARWLAEYRQKAFFRGETDLLKEAESLAFFKGDKQTKIVQNPGTGEWTFAAPAGYGLADLAGDPQAQPGTFSGVRPLVNALTALQAQAADDYIEVPEALEKYGLDPNNKDTLRIEVKPKDGPADVVYIGKRVDDKSDKFFCKLATDTSVVKVSVVPERVAAFAKLATDPSDLRDRTLIPDTQQLSIDALDIVQGTTITKLRRTPTISEPRWTLYGGPTDPQYTGTTVQELINALAKPRIAKEVLTAPYDAVFADAEKKAELRIWYDGTEKSPPSADPNKLPAEPKLKGNPSLTLIFGKKEADFVFVRRITADGIRTDMKLPDTVLPLVQRDRLTYIDPRFKTFPTNTAKKVTLVRGGETIIVESDGKAHADQWKFLAPDRLKGQVADIGKVSEFVGMIAIMNPTKAVAENPTDADLPKYGVGAAAKLKMTIAFDTDKEPERTFEFGNETEDKSLVYLRSNTRPLVVSVSRIFFDRLNTEDLRDRRLYEMDKSKVKTIILKGWKQALKQPTTYRFEKMGDKWTVKEPATEKGTLDPSKIEIFLAALAAPRAVNFIPGGLKPAEHGFDIATAPNTLEIHFELEGLPGIGFHLLNETDGGTNYFAWTTAKKDDAFTFSAQALREFKEKPQAFFK